MRINKSYFRKLSDQELLKYLKTNTPYTSEAVKLAVDILEKERKYLFTDEDKIQINELIQLKKQNALTRSQEYNEDYMVLDSPENSHFPKLHSKTYIVGIGTAFSVLAAGYFVLQNLKDLNLNHQLKNRKLILSTIFCFAILIGFMSIYYLYGYEIMLENDKSSTRSFRRYRFNADTAFFYIYIFVNFFLTHVIWGEFMPSNQKYRAKNDNWTK